MTREEKYELISELERQKVLRELCPVSFNYRDTAYWHYEVLEPNKLPESLKGEYQELGEIRW